MKPGLSEDDKTRLEERIAKAEELTKSQIVLATVRRSDNYPEIPWKAFAMGASITGLIVFTTNLVLLKWIEATTVLLSVVATLAGAAVSILLTVLFPGIARLFITRGRAESETRQYAESLFMSRELFSTAGRDGVLILISLFERKVIILPDINIRNRVSSDELGNIINLMKEPLARNEVRHAMEIALDELIRIIVPLSPGEKHDDELSNRIIEEKGS